MRTIILLIIIFFINCRYVATTNNVPLIKLLISLPDILKTDTNSSNTGTGTSSVITPSGLTYTGSPYSFTQNVAITTITPTITGTVTSCSSSPNLPTGLSISNTTCAISGTPTTTSAATDYTITASNSGGTTTASINITVILQVETPTFSPVAGFYNTPQYITISSVTNGSTIYYATDGTTPTTNSTVYSSSMHIWSIAGKTIKAVAVKSGMADSSILSGVFSYPPLKTGQTSCYDASNNPVTCSTTYKGQDAQENQGVARSYIGPTQHPIYTNDYTMTDNATGLVWKTCSQGLSGADCSSGTAVTLTWDNASNNATNGCIALNYVNSGNGYAGRRDWRLPTIQELFILVDINRKDPTINVASFPAKVNGYYWSYTTSASNVSNAWTVAFHYGGLNNDGGSANTFNVHCLSGQSTPELHNYTDNKDGTIIDNGTSLLWQKCSAGLNNDSTCSGIANMYTWAEAISYCNSLVLLNKTWRLPNRNELESLIDTTKTSSPTIDSTAFPSTGGISYWSSSTYIINATKAWEVTFSNGGSNAMDKTSNSHYVRCVSGP